MFVIETGENEHIDDVLFNNRGVINEAVREKGLKTFGVEGSKTYYRGLVFGCLGYSEFLAQDSLFLIPLSVTSLYAIENGLISFLDNTPTYDLLVDVKDFTEKHIRLLFNINNRLLEVKPSKSEIQYLIDKFVALEKYELCTYIKNNYINE